MNHIALVLFWIIYYTLHSIFAATSVKDFLKKNLGKYFRYYRLSYSIFATIGLGCLLYFQYSFASPLLIKSEYLKYFAILFLIFPGVVIMWVSIKKYFFLLSGIRSLFTPVSATELKLTGIHRYVRHPLYAGTILFVCGLFFVFPTLSNFITVFILISYVLTGIIFEEKKLVKEFGKNYEQYISKVPMLIPSFKKIREISKK